VSLKGYSYTALVDLNRSMALIGLLSLTPVLPPS
jgi:hypothetical protein